MNNFTDLLGILNRANRVDNPQLFQTVSELIKRLQKNQEGFTQAVSSVISSGGGGGIGASVSASYLTAGPEPGLSNSRQLIAGAGVSFDDSIAGERIINVSGVGSGASYVPMTVGLDLNIMSNGFGEVLMVPYEF